MRRLFPYLRPYKRQAIMAVVSMLVFALASGVQPYLISLVIDEYIPKGDLSGVTAIGAALIGLSLIGWAAQYVQQVATSFMGHRILRTLRMQMFATSKLC
jgi:ATP-binding cassette subfamily B protein